ncbi:hypothetical protein [Candidatus Trichorickettsia mobilis]|uniref:hypothetical protein n=1 Tax=Candidatus Trichorickettsia mobilis TaxID=1346319 RepID=UPI00292FB48F|nr:hypothetical protein [Candidatus Trichorickettsia mobilis]
MVTILIRFKKIIPKYESDETCLPKYSPMIMPAIMPISTRCQAEDWLIDFKIFIRFFDVDGILRVNEKLVDEVLVEDPLGAPSRGAQRT